MSLIFKFLKNCCCDKDNRVRIKTLFATILILLALGTSYLCGSVITIVIMISGDMTSLLHILLFFPLFSIFVAFVTLMLMIFGGILFFGLAFGIVMIVGFFGRWINHTRKKIIEYQNNIHMVDLKENEEDDNSSFELTIDQEKAATAL